MCALVGKGFYNFNYFNNQRILKFVCISWKIKFMILVMRGATMKTMKFGSVCLKLGVILQRNSIYRPKYFTAAELLFNILIIYIIGITELRDLMSSLECS